jgi:hypothetical protein
MSRQTREVRRAVPPASPEPVDEHTEEDAARAAAMVDSVPPAGITAPAEDRPAAADDRVPAVAPAREGAGREGAARPEKCPSCGEPTVEIADFRNPPAAKPFVGWGCNTPGCDAPGAMARVPEEDLSDLPEPLQGAILCFGLKRADVLEHRLTEDGVVIVTRGGRKLRWPGDEDRAASLTPEEKDGVPRRDFPPANLFGKKD